MLIGGAKGHVFLPRKNHGALRRPMEHFDTYYDLPPAITRLVVAATKSNPGNEKTGKGVKEKRRRGQVRLITISRSICLI